MKKKRLINTVLVGTALLLSIPSVTAQTSSNHDQDSNSTNLQTIENTYLYTPYIFYQHYDYGGEGNEFAGHKATLTYPLDAKGVFQIKLETAGITMAIVFQISDDGVYELSYFPDDDGTKDYRQHPDSLDELRSLILPRSLTVGETFQSGYSDQMTYQLIKIEPEYQASDNKIYHNVMVLALNETEENVTYEYLAPGIGLLENAFVFKKDDFDSIREFLETTSQAQTFDHLPFYKDYQFDLLEGETP